MTPDDEFMVMATDGLWDVLDNQQVVNFVRNRMKDTHCAQRVASSLIKKAIEIGTGDNISIVVVALQQRWES